MTRDALMKQVCHKCTHMTDKPEDSVIFNLKYLHILEFNTLNLKTNFPFQVSVADSVENNSVGHESHGSEKSWEAVDEKDTRPPLWVPDYAATQCMGCCQNFWLGRR